MPVAIKANLHNVCEEKKDGLLFTQEPAENALRHGARVRVCVCVIGGRTTTVDYNPETPPYWNCNLQSEDAVLSQTE